MCIYNIQEIRRKRLFEKFIEFAENYKNPLGDQDVLNAACQGSIHFLDRSWNVMGGVHFHPAWTTVTVEEFKYLEEHAKIYHYSGGKPNGLRMDHDFFLSWWHCARKTPFYEKLLHDGLCRIMDHKLQPDKGAIKK